MYTCIDKNDVQRIITAPQIKQKVWCSIVVEMLRSINVEYKYGCYKFILG